MSGPKNCARRIGGGFLCEVDEGSLTRVQFHDRAEWFCREHAEDAAGPGHATVSCDCGTTTLVPLIPPGMPEPLRAGMCPATWEMRVHAGGRLGPPIALRCIYQGGHLVLPPRWGAYADETRHAARLPNGELFAFPDQESKR